MKTYLEIKDNICYVKHDEYIKRFNLNELVTLSNAIKNTIKEYNDNNINDEIVKYLNKKERNDYLKKNNDNTLLKKNRNKNKKGIYLISEENKFLKIGVSEYVEKRLKQLKTSNHNHLRILYHIKGIGKIEKLIHEYFVKYHKENEWFYYSDSIIDFFEKLDKNKELFDNLYSQNDLKYAFNKLIKI